MQDVLKTSFTNIDMKGVFGNEKIMQYYDINKKSVARIRKVGYF